MTDPRFDPAFQRGYSGPAPELIVRAVAPAEAVAVPDAAAQPVAEVPVPLPRVAPTAASVVSPPVLEPEPGSRFAIRNPFRFALLLLGPLLLLIALWSLYGQVMQQQAGGQPLTTVQDQFLSLLRYSLPPSLVLAGFAAFILWLALGALDHALDVDAPDPVDPVGSD